MPPRFTYWTIIAGGLPTAFRATDRDEILPTFQRLREKHPDAVLKWFARGKLWDSPEEARAALEQRHRPSDRRGDRRSRFEGRGPRPNDGRTDSHEQRRDRDWRPGGDHRDPRKKFADAKKARNAAHRQQRFDRKHGSAKPWSGNAPRDRFTSPPRPPESRGRNERRTSDLRERPRGRKPFQPKSSPPRPPESHGRDERRTSDLREQPHGKKPFRPKSSGHGEHDSRRRQAQGTRTFERPGFQRKPEATSGRKPQGPSNFHEPSSPRRDDDSPRRPTQEDRQRRGRFRRS